MPAGASSSTQSDLFMAFILLLLVTGCGKTYELPWDQFCIKIDGNKEIVLSAEDKNVIIDLLNKGDWINDLGNCGCEYVFFTRNQEVRYHSECGTFNDYTNKRSYTVSEEERKKINAILNNGDESKIDPKTLTLTVAETFPSLVTFEYKDSNPYCFYAYDSERNYYRIIWSNFDDLNEKAAITVTYSDEIKKLNETNPPGEWSVKYEVIATGVIKK